MTPVLSKPQSAFRWAAPSLPVTAAAFVVTAAALAAAFPVQLSIAAVFVFAGPHNWFEARYFASRMPVRWDRQRGFFFTALLGVAALSVTFSLVPVNRSLWHAALIAWALCLVRMRRRDLLTWFAPIALTWAALVFAAPVYADLALVYLHPLAALWFVRRQIVKSRPQWRSHFRAVAFALPALAVLIVSARAGRPASDMVQLATFAPLPASGSLVALHAFLELLHYGSWALLLPAIGLSTAPWRVASIPLARHRLGWPRLITSLLAAGAVVVALLWVLFAIDFQMTRDIYFSVAIVHVLAEVPFLVWLR